MNKSGKTRRTWSMISILHAWKLGARSLLFLLAIVCYVLGTVFGHTDAVLGALEDNWWFLILVWVFFVAEMILRFFPSRFESMGCQKQFRRNFTPTDMHEPNLPSAKGTLITFIVWIALNGAIAALYFTGVIDAGILIIISLFYSVCDMICILFFCPFQTWFMKNKCCGSCRIYNWDYAMMFTPLVLIIHPYTQSLFTIALLLVVVWEVTLRLCPERFAENTNASLTCANCKEKLCHHKTQLRGYLAKNRELMKKYLKERERKK